jgi:hypothetical protein
MTMPTFQLGRAGEVVSFRTLADGQVRFHRVRDKETLELRILSVTEARQRWQELKDQGYRIVR